MSFKKVTIDQLCSQQDYRSLVEVLRGIHKRIRVCCKALKLPTYLRYESSNHGTFLHIRHPTNGLTLEVMIFYWDLEHMGLDADPGVRVVVDRIPPGSTIGDSFGVVIYPPAPELEIRSRTYLSRRPGGSSTTGTEGEFWSSYPDAPLKEESDDYRIGVAMVESLISFFEKNPRKD